MIDDLACQELVELVTEYLENELSPEQRTRFEAHLEACRHCREYLAQMRQTVDALGQVSLDSLSPEALGELQRAFQGWTRETG
jgi:anti-sigma factor RsiW